MSLISKYKLRFEPIDIGFIDGIEVKLVTLFSILKLELFYYRNPIEISRLIMNILLIGVIFTIHNIDTASVIQIVSLLIILNSDILILLFNPKTPVTNNDKTSGDLYIDVEVNKEETELTLKGMYRNKHLFLITHATMDPKLLILLVNDYLNKTDSLEEYKKKFIKNNIEIELVNWFILPLVFY